MLTLRNYAQGRKKDRFSINTKNKEKNKINK